jgi:DNA (cytosine-5)-methyltransferase 1
MRPRLLDLFCGAGGAAAGYHRAGFDVVGVDNRPQPNYPFEFVEADALLWLKTLADIGDFVAIHASPPCQAFSVTRSLWKDRQGTHPELVAPTREALEDRGVPYVIENVVGAPLVDPLMLCGSSLGLNVRRHRLFETNWPLMVPPCSHGWQTPRFATQISQTRAKVSKARIASVVSVSGHGSEFYDAGVVHVYGSTGGKGGIELWKAAMGIDWMTRDELSQAIPPAYTELIGHQLMAHVRCEGSHDR